LFCQSNYQIIITYSNRDSSENKIGASTATYSLGKGKSETKYFICNKEVDKAKHDKRKYADSVMYVSSVPLYLITLDFEGDTISKAFINLKHLFAGQYSEYYKNGKIKTLGNYFDETLDTTKFLRNGTLQSEIIQLPYGYKEGLWNYFDENGILIRSELFVKGEKK
jgi:antitoxin component YwqK of YwqJK toxin-antitoxin module